MVIHLLENVQQHKSEINLAPLAIVAALIPGLQPAVTAISGVAALASGAVTASPSGAQRALGLASIIGGPQVAPSGGGGGSSMSTDLGFSDSEHSLGLAYTPPYSDVFATQFPVTAAAQGLGGVLGSIWQNIAPFVTGAGIGAATTAAAGAFAPAVGTAAMGVGMIGTLARAFPAIEAVVPRLLLRAAPYAAVAASIYEVYKQLRARGMSHKQAKNTALRVHGVLRRRRRMRSTNVHALRRAIRRVRSARRILSKIHGLSPRHSAWRAGGGYRRRRGYRRGDVSPFEVEDRADMRDEAEDFDLEPESAVWE